MHLEERGLSMNMYKIELGIIWPKLDVNCILKEGISYLINIKGMNLKMG